MRPKNFKIAYFLAFFSVSVFSEMLYILYFFIVSVRALFALK